MKSKTHALTLGLVLFGSSLSANELELAIDAALQSPRSEFLQNTPASSVTFSNHHLKLYPVFVIEAKKPAHTIGGRIVSATTNGVERSVAYRIMKHRGVIKEVLLQIDEGTPQAMSASMMKALGIFLEKAGGDSTERNAVTAALHKASDGSWLSIIELVVAQIGMSHC
jgi:hypothetical protein